MYFLLYGNIWNFGTKLNNVAKALKLGSFEHHRADEDALILSKIYIELINRLKTKKGFTNLGQINEIVSEIDVKKLKSYHQIILVRNQAGLKNLYRLVSISNLEYFYKKPLIPKSVLMEHREGLIFGVFMICIFTSRFFIEFLKNDQEAFEADMLLNMGQLLSIPFVLAGIWFVVRACRAQAKPNH